MLQDTPTPVDITGTRPASSTNAIATTATSPFQDENLNEFQLPNDTGKKRSPNSSETLSHKRTSSATSVIEECSRTNSFNTVDQPTEVFADRTLHDGPSQRSQRQIRRSVTVRRYSSVTMTSDEERRQSSAVVSDHEWLERDDVFVAFTLSLFGTCFG